jgi:hypothetical protein
MEQQQYQSSALSHSHHISTNSINSSAPSLSHRNKS